jgi:hypothetical protein
VNISYDEAFETRVSADIKVRFGGASTTAQRKEVQQLPVINALTSTPAKRDVRVHDAFFLAPVAASIGKLFAGQVVKQGAKQVGKKTFQDVAKKELKKELKKEVKNQVKDILRDDSDD